MNVVLWHFPVSHYNEKVRWALDWKKIPHQRKVLTLDYLPRALLATGKPTLPILFLDDRAIGDSTLIIEALEALQPAPGLYPTDPPDRRRALALEDFFDEELGHPVRTALVGWAFYERPDIAIRALSNGMGDGPRRLMTKVFPVFRGFYTWRHKITQEGVDAARAKVRECLDRIERESRGRLGVWRVFSSYLHNLKKFDVTFQKVRACLQNYFQESQKSCGRIETKFRIL